MQVNDDAGDREQSRVLWRPSRHQDVSVLARVQGPPREDARRLRRPGPALRAEMDCLMGEGDGRPPAGARSSRRCGAITPSRREASKRSAPLPLGKVARGVLAGEENGPCGITDQHVPRAARRPMAHRHFGREVGDRYVESSGYENGLVFTMRPERGRSTTASPGGG
jgi:hypothetical protein